MPISNMFGKNMPIFDKITNSIKCFLDLRPKDYEPDETDQEALIEHIKYISKTIKVDLKHVKNRMCPGRVFSLLGFYCREGNLTMVRILVEKFDFDQDHLKNSGIDNYGEYYGLRWACQNGHFQIVKYLCEHFDLDINAIRSGKNFPIRAACLSGGFEMVKYLTDRYNFTKDDILDSGTEEDQKGWILRHCFLNGGNKSLKYLIWKFEIDIEDIDASVDDKLLRCSLKLAFDLKTSTHKSNIARKNRQKYQKVVQEISKLREQSIKSFFDNPDNKIATKIIISLMDEHDIDNEKIQYYIKNFQD